MLVNLNDKYDKKMKIIEKLGELGIKEVEIGSLFIEERINTFDNIKSNIFKKIRFRSLVRPCVDDIKKAAKAGADIVVIILKSNFLTLFSISSGANIGHRQNLILNELEKSINYCKDQELEIIIEISNASALSLDIIFAVIDFCKKLGVKRFSYQEEDEVIDPLLFKNRIEKIIQLAEIDLEVNCSNILMTAVASSLAAYKAGVISICASINGYSQKNYGRTALEEIMMVLIKLENIENKYNTKIINQLSQTTASYLGEIIPQNKAIIGKSIFTHESGIHVDGILKNSKTYEAYSPEDVGLKRKIVLGKHSGKKAVIAKYKEFGIDIDQDTAVEKLNKIKKKSIELKRTLTEEEIKNI